MGIKICKSCKKPMRSTDTHCRTCGAEFRNNPVIIIIIFLIILGGLLFASYSFFFKNEGKSEKEGMKTSEVKKPVPTTWVMEENIDKMTDEKNYYLSNKATNAETGKPVDAGFTIGCSYFGGLNGVFTSDTPIKTKDITKDGVIGEYSIRFDEKPMEYGSSELTSLNRVVVLSGEHLQQIENSKKVLIRITTGVDNYRTFEINSEGGVDLFKAIKEFCMKKTKENKAP